MRTKSGYNIFRLINAGLITAVVVIALICTLVFTMDIKGTSGSSKSVNIDVAKGDNAVKIANTLKDNGIITNKMVFRIWTALNYTDPAFQYGRHVLNSHMSYSEIVTVLQDPYVAETISITFPEGTTALKMGMMFEEAGIFTADEFMEACNDDYSDVFDYFDEISDDDLKFCRLEGFLYPDTYEFYEDDTPHNAIAKMLKNFQKKVLTEDNLKLIEESGMSLEDVVKLSSIVQKETQADETITRTIASIFLNRLANLSTYPHLETDTSREGYGYVSGVIMYYYDNNPPAGMVAAYDTYVCSGLPVGAICNPGIDVINGVLNPLETGYYYFVNDKSGQEYYASTYEEHQANIQKVNEFNATYVPPENDDKG